MTLGFKHAQEVSGLPSALPSEQSAGEGRGRVGKIVGFEVRQSWLQATALPLTNATTGDGVSDPLWAFLHDLNFGKVNNNPASSLG